jgi:hypothetical protein
MLYPQRTNAACSPRYDLSDAEFDAQLDILLFQLEGVQGKEMNGQL